MTRSTQADIDELLESVQSCFPDGEVLAALSAPGAIDDVPREHLAMLTGVLRSLPATLPDELRIGLRDQLLGLRAADQAAEARAAASAQRQEVSAKRRAELAASGQALHERIAQYKAEQEAGKAQRTADSRERHAALEARQAERAQARAARDAAREQRHAEQAERKAAREAASAAAKKERDAATEARKAARREKT